MRTPSGEPNRYLRLIGGPLLLRNEDVLRFAPRSPGTGAQRSKTDLTDDSAPSFSVFWWTKNLHALLRASLGDLASVDRLSSLCTCCLFKFTQCRIGLSDLAWNLSGMPRLHFRNDVRDSHCVVAAVRRARLEPSVSEIPGA